MFCGSSDADRLGTVEETVLAQESMIDAKRSGEREAILEAALQSAEAFYGIGVINGKLEANRENRRALRELQSMMERRVENRVSPNIDLQVTSLIDLLDIMTVG